MQAFQMAGQALQLVGTLAGGSEAEKVGNYNAEGFERQAAATRLAAGERENLTRQRGARTLADQRAALLQGGVSPTTGTALIGVQQNAVDAELDALTVRYEGLMEAQGLQSQAAMSRYEGKSKKRQAYISAAGQLMSASSQYLGKKQAPAPVETRDLSRYTVKR
jgi:hypothetical protein